MHPRCSVDRNDANAAGKAQYRLVTRAEYHQGIDSA